MENPKSRWLIWNSGTAGSRQGTEKGRKKAVMWKSGNQEFGVGNGGWGRVEGNRRFNLELWNDGKTARNGKAAAIWTSGNEWEDGENGPSADNGAGSGRISFSWPASRRSSLPDNSYFIASVRS
jgi:hypothetical protein